MKRRLQVQLARGAILLFASAASFAGDNPPADRFIAGSTPDRRPAGAPVIRTHGAGPEGRQAATRGVGEPIPLSLKFLDDQGAWYTPFDQPGMPGYYDLRQMHATLPAKSKSKP